MYKTVMISFNLKFDMSRLLAGYVVVMQFETQPVATFASHTPELMCLTMSVNLVFSSLTHMCCLASAFSTINMISSSKKKGFLFWSRVPCGISVAIVVVWCGRGCCVCMLMRYYEAHFKVINSDYILLHLLILYILFPNPCGRVKDFFGLRVLAFPQNFPPFMSLVTGKGRVCIVLNEDKNTMNWVRGWGTYRLRGCSCSASQSCTLFLFKQTLKLFHSSHNTWRLYLILASFTALLTSSRASLLSLVLR